MEVSIIIINYNTVSLLCDAIDSVLEKTTDISYEIIVVDNNSSDNSENIIPEKYSEKVVFLKLPENIGFGRANNEGVKIAKGRNIFFLNPDTILVNNAVRILSDYLDNHSEVAVCGGNLYDADMKPTHSFARHFFSVFYEVDFFFMNCLSRIKYGKNSNFNYSEKELEVMCIVGADLMIKKLVFEKVGGFDPDFFMYHEEQELCFRMNKNRYKIMSVPTAKIIHLEGKSFTSNWSRLKIELGARSLFYKKTHTSLHKKIADGIYRANAISRILLLTLTKNKEKKNVWLYRLKNIK